jgi:hypothetical protein
MGLAHQEESGQAHALPTKWSKMELPDKFKLTVEGKQFCIMDSVVGNKIIGFGSSNMLAVLQNSDEWFVDGMFDVVKQVTILLFSGLGVLLCLLPPP